MDTKIWLNEMSTKKLLGIELTNIENIYIQKAVIPIIQKEKDDEITIPSESEILHYLLQNSMLYYTST